MDLTNIAKLTLLISVKTSILELYITLKLWSVFALWFRGVSSDDVVA